MLSEDFSAGAVDWVFRLFAVVAALAFLALALLFALTIPYHDWDAFAYGEWSRRIATSHAFDPAPLGPYPAGRPVFFVLQGLAWWVTGVSFVVGRLLSLAFAVVAVSATALLLRRGEGRQFALLVFLSITYFSVEAVAGKTDVPAAAAVAALVAVALRDPFRRQTVYVGLLTVLAVLTKPSSVIPAVCGLVLALLVTEKKPRSLSAFARSRGGATLGGLVVGLAYEWAMAVHFDLGVVAFLRAGTTGYYAQLADSVRWTTLLRLDFLGADLRLPLAFALVYACCRSARLAHRPSAVAALFVGGGYAVVGPFFASESHGPFVDAYSTFAFVGFALVLAVTAFAPPEFVPDATRTTQLLLIAVPPTVVWAIYGVYENRLEAPAWPALAALMGSCLYCAVGTARHFAGVAGVAVIPVLGVVLWASLVTFDGFHEPLWVEFRALGTSGVWDRDRTTNIVLPAVSESVAALRPELGTSGRLLTSDPHFFFWFDRTTIGYPTTCGALEKTDGFILSTSDESRTVMEQRGGSPDPATWAACKKPRLRELTDGSNGLAVFVVQH